MCLLERYENPSDIGLRIGNTVIRYEGQPVLILGVGDGILFRYLSTAQRESVPLTKEVSKRFDVTPVPLGYVNYPQGCVFLTRNPVRRPKQGLSKEALNIAHNSTGVRFRFDDLIGVELHRTILGHYPKASECVRRILSPFTKEIAFDREFSVGRGRENIRLCYRGKVVGGFNPERYVFNLSPKYKYLREKLQGVSDVEPA